MSGAGGSAQREYERRRARDRERRRRVTPRALILIPVVGIGIYLGIVLVIAPMINNALAGATTSGKKHAKAAPAFPDSTVQLVAVLFAAGAMLTLGKEAWGRRATTEAWAKGAEGERLTARALESLEADGYVLLNDLRIPGKRSNVDHVLVGPSGVYVIESKNYSGTVKITSRTVMLNGRRRDKDIEEVLREAEVVEAALGDRTEAVEVTPVLWLHAGEVAGSLFSDPVVQGVGIGSSRKLPGWIRGRPKILSQDEVRAVAGILDADLGRGEVLVDPLPQPPNTPPRPDVAPETSTGAGSPCTCGGVFVVRTRRSDGGQFLGCSRFPKCREARPLLP